MTVDGTYVWMACGGQLNALNPDSGKIERTIEAPAHAGGALMASICPGVRDGWGTMRAARSTRSTPETARS